MTDLPADFSADYLTGQIIAYIGNKRRLLPLIQAGLERALGRAPGEGIPRGLTFFDAFAGSGVVSRFAKHRGFRVLCNDWEPYSYIINRGYVAANRRDLARLFGSEKEFAGLLDHLNNPALPSGENLYISRYYAPAGDDPGTADFRRERLFYTRANALAIDGIRGEIDRLFPPGADGEDGRLRRDILIALLLYQAATHTNTSGVFKAFHKGFGGHGGDALKRILAPIRLVPPPLIDSDMPCRIFRQDAALLAGSPDVRGADAAYLDPPYNQHQYGSNYHLLNTIAVWDKRPAPLEFEANGVLKEKAGIRKDWTLTRSDYCSAPKAAKAFGELLAGLDAEHILVSYSTDGIIPWKELREICASRGDVSIVTNEYVTYRGGKQSDGRKNVNIEFILTIGPRRKGGAAGTCPRAVDDVLALREVGLYFRRKFSHAGLSRNFEILRDGSLKARLAAAEVYIATRDLFSLDPPGNLDTLSPEDLALLRCKLADSVCVSAGEELEEIFSRLDGDPGVWGRRLAAPLRKLAHKKNRAVFLDWLDRIHELAGRRPDIYPAFGPAIDRIERIAAKRFVN